MLFIDCPYGGWEVFEAWCSLAIGFVVFCEVLALSLPPKSTELPERQRLAIRLLPLISLALLMIVDTLILKVIGRIDSYSDVAISAMLLMCPAVAVTVLNVLHLQFASGRILMRFLYETLVGLILIACEACLLEIMKY